MSTARPLGVNAGRENGDGLDGESEGREVIAQKDGPVRSANRPTPRVLCDPDHTPNHGYDQPARCELHGINVVDEFPCRCPLATANPLTTLTQLRAAAWREIGKPWSDPERDSENAHDLLAQGDVCCRCLSMNLTHQTFRRLRRKAELST